MLSIATSATTTTTSVSHSEYILARERILRKITRSIVGAHKDQWKCSARQAFRIELVDLLL
jgi:hypothetical protein